MVQCDHFMKIDGRHVKLKESIAFPRGRPVRYQALHLGNSLTGGNADADLLGADGNNLSYGSFIMMGFVRFARWTVMESRCDQIATSAHHAPSRTGESWFIGCSGNRIPQQLGRIDVEDLPEGVIHIPRELCNSALAKLTSEHASRLNLDGAGKTASIGRSG
jgi:hypothetical protein